MLDTTETTQLWSKTPGQIQYLVPNLQNYDTYFKAYVPTKVHWQCMYVFGILKIIFNTIIVLKEQYIDMGFEYHGIFLKRRLYEAVNLLIISKLLLITN